MGRETRRDETNRRRVGRWRVGATTRCKVHAACMRVCACARCAVRRAGYGEIACVAWACACACACLRCSLFSHLRADVLVLSEVELALLLGRDRRPRVEREQHVLVQHRLGLLLDRLRKRVVHLPLPLPLPLPRTRTRTTARRSCQHGGRRVASRGAASKCRVATRHARRARGERAGQAGRGWARVGGSGSGDAPG